MKAKYSVIFHEVQQPITQLVTKFGGQPNWLTGPQWPISRATEEPMRFIGQIALDPAIFGDVAGQMAYLFISIDDGFVERTFDPDSGENAVIIQPGGKTNIPTQPLETGPTLYKLVSRPDGEEPVEEDGEFAVELVTSEDPDSIEENEEAHSSDETWRAFTARWKEVKIGGAPVFLQGPEYPGEGHWQLLLQLDSANVPFVVDFGDAGIGYAFLAEDGMSGKFLWQSL